MPPVVGMAEPGQLTPAALAWISGLGCLFPARGGLGRLGKCRGLNRIERGRKSARESVWGRSGAVSGA